MPNARQGQPLVIRNQPVEFSFSPVAKTTRRYGLQTRVFTSDPWAVMAEGIAEKCPKASKEAALAFNAQAEDFYDASQSSKLPYAKPLLLYYSFMNLVKALILMAGKATASYRPHHGMSENANLRQVEGARVVVYPSSKKSRQIFGDFYSLLTGSELTKKKSLRLGYLLPQILFGHRLWCSAAKQSERFVTIQKFEFMNDPDAQTVWLRFLLKREELARVDVSQHEMLTMAGLSGDWHFVHLDHCEDLCIEQMNPNHYTHRPSDDLLDVTNKLRQKLWSSVLLHPPYRKYYLYLAPLGQKGAVLPQLLSMFVVIFFLGSITRYRPHHFERLLDSHYGAHLLGALNEVPAQFIYLLASEMLKREVTKASIAS
ncbi:MAG: YaaC family protein [Terriglobia bacterium]